MLAGPEIENHALQGTKYVELPYSVKGMDLTYSGLLTAAKKLVDKVSKQDLCYSFQETAFAMLVETAERALAHSGKKEILLVGRCAANQRLRQMLETMGKPHSARFFVPKNEFNGDNGAMIALVGALKARPDKEIDINPRWRTDAVDVTWA